jgi:hypothetical protein
MLQMLENELLQSMAMEDQQLARQISSKLMQVHPVFSTVCRTSFAV